MQINVNGANHNFLEEILTISELLIKLKYTYPIIIVKYKSMIIDKNDFDNVLLLDGDSIDIIHIFAGG
ncbi:MAG: sulfur carrier protein ThiS [Candidatus Cloacimonetes bacterium]|nr:sulfur carrier protein ThiS [Candidatus Cloacimonadota bacterium]